MLLPPTNGTRSADCRACHSRPHSQRLSLSSGKTHRRRTCGQHSLQAESAEISQEPITSIIYASCALYTNCYYCWCKLASATTYWHIHTTHTTKDGQQWGFVIYYRLYGRVPDIMLLRRRLDGLSSCRRTLSERCASGLVCRGGGGRATTFPAESLRRVDSSRRGFSVGLFLSR
jgi:hypothetical protein